MCISNLLLPLRTLCFYQSVRWYNVVPLILENLFWGFFCMLLMTVTTDHYLSQEGYGVRPGHLSVSHLAGLGKNYWTDFNAALWEDGEEPNTNIKFCF